jgi:hypothetical protein
VSAVAILAPAASADTTESATKSSGDRGIAST